VTPAAGLYGMLSIMKHFILILGLLVVLPAGGGELYAEIPARVWAEPRDGHSLSRLEGLGELVKALGVDGRQRLLIHYPGGEEGSLRAAELRSWLVALGIASRHIELVPGGNGTAALGISLDEGMAP